VPVIAVINSYAVKSWATKRSTFAYIFRVTKLLERDLLKLRKQELPLVFIIENAKNQWQVSLPYEFWTDMVYNLGQYTISIHCNEQGIPLGSGKYYAYISNISSTDNVVYPVWPQDSVLPQFARIP